MATQLTRRSDVSVGPFKTICIKADNGNRVFFNSNGMFTEAGQKMNYVEALEALEIDSYPIEILKRVTPERI